MASRTENQRRRLFATLSESLCAAGMHVGNDETLVCPLCWKETEYQELRLEHILPRSLGGKRVTLTCRACNNTHGSELESSLAGFQKTINAFRGRAAIRGTLDINGRKVATNFAAGPHGRGKNFEIVGPASDLAVVAEISEDCARGNVDVVKVTLRLGYNPNRLQAALVRVAFLYLFELRGYEYIKTRILQDIRRRICGASSERAQLKTLIASVHWTPGQVRQPLGHVRFDLEGISCFVVVVPLQSDTATSRCVIMPEEPSTAHRFFETMEALAGRTGRLL